MTHVQSYCSLKLNSELFTEAFDALEMNIQYECMIPVGTQIIIPLIKLVLLGLGLKFAGEIRIDRFNFQNYHTI